MLPKEQIGVKMSFPDTHLIIRNASQIKNIAEDMNRLNNGNLQNATENISAVWRGEAATTYLRHCATTHDLIRTTANELLSIANELEQLARQLGLA
jgi:uncharacterized protein YukE